MERKLKSKIISTRWCKTLLSKYAKFTKRSIIIALKDKVIHIQSNGSVIETLKSANGNIRGNRAKYLNYYDDFEEVDKQMIEDSVKFFISSKEV